MIPYDKVSAEPVRCTKGLAVLLVKNLDQLMRLLVRLAAVLNFFFLSDGSVETSD